MKKIIAVSLLLVSVGAGAQSLNVPPAAAPVASSQSVDPASSLGAWLASQQAQIGVSYDFNRTKYADTWWDAVSVGQSGINIGAASALDYLDLGPGVAAANGAATRYGLVVPLHVGNIWNSLPGKMPKAVSSHVHTFTAPNVTAGGMFLVPNHRPLDKWNWTQDFQATLAYRFGGAPLASTGGQ